MAASNGDQGSRLDRIEAQLEKLSDLVLSMAAHSEEVERRLNTHDKQIMILRNAQLETNENTKALVEAIRSLIDRIPPENLR